MLSAASHKPVCISELAILLSKPSAGLIDLVCFELPHHNDRHQSLQNTDYQLPLQKNELPPTLTGLDP